MTTINHYGHTVNSEIPVTGVLSSHSVAWEWISDEICLTCEEIYNDIQEDESINEEDKESECDSVECDSAHTKIMGDWIKDSDGKYMPDESKEFAAIIRESVVQVVWSKYTASGALCSPCYPGQVDLDSKGDYLAFTLPDELLTKED